MRRAGWSHWQGEGLRQLWGAPAWSAWRRFWPDPRQLLTTAQDPPSWRGPPAAGRWGGFEGCAGRSIRGDLYSPHSLRGAVRTPSGGGPIQGTGKKRCGEGT